MKNKILVLCVLAVFISCAYVFAETIHFNSGRVIKGEVVAKEGDKVVVRIGEGDDTAQITFFSDEIKSIDAEEEVKAEEAAAKSPTETERPAAQEEEEVLSLPEQEETVEAEIEPEETEPAAEVQPEIKEQPEAGVVPAAEAPVVEEEQFAPEAKTPTEATPVPPAQPKVEPELQPQTTVIEPQQQEPASPQSQETQVAPQDDAASKEQQVLEELTSLLDNSEREYFNNINSIASDVINKTMQILANPESLTQDVEQLPKMMQDLSSDIDGIVTKLKSVQPPATFKEFHNDYIDNLNLLKDMLSDMAGGNVAASQAKINDLQNANIKIQQELSRILTEKKSKPQTNTTNASN